MRLKEYYQKEVMPKMKEKFSFSNDLEVPRLEKVVLNVGFGRHSKENEYVAQVVKTLESITGQKPLLTKAKVSVSAFKVR
jgi:large subunit ribosomal protein L5